MSDYGSNAVAAASDAAVDREALRSSVESLTRERDKAASIIQRLESHFGWRVNRSGIGGRWTLKDAGAALDADVSSARDCLSSLPTSADDGGR